MFHYTSATGLLGILSSRTLWASEVAGLNDVAEVTGGLDVAERWLRAREPSSLGDALLDMVARLRDGHLGGAADVFVLSASLDGDDANQWRVYGNGGFGYSIELDSSAPLSVVVEPESLESRPRQEAGTYNLDADDASTSEWVRVAYSDGEHHQVMDSLFAWAAGTVPSNRRPADLVNLLEGLVLVFGIGYGLESAVRLIKGAGFSGEREARIFTMASFGGGRTVGFHPSPFGVVRHLELTHDTRNPSGGLVARDRDQQTIETCTLPIKSITLGPRLDLAAGRSALWALLERAGYEPEAIELCPSRVTLR